MSFPPPQGRALAYGHYIADVRNGPGDTWLRFNDETVTALGPNVMYSEAAEQDAYLLVFKSRELWRWATPPKGAAEGEGEKAVLGKRGREAGAGQQQGGEKRGRSSGGGAAGAGAAGGREGGDGVIHID